MGVLRIGKEKVLLGERKKIILPVARLYDCTDLNMIVQVIRGKKDGPTVFLSAAIHGDEVNGIEIIREVLSYLSLKEIRGTIIAVPIVNVFGFNSRSRYLPDRRDLNRSFPGLKTGSLASRIANLFVNEIVSKCTHGIDFHSGSSHRTNLPQIRADLSQPKTRAFAQAFGAPIMLDAKSRDGSLRETARKKGVTTLLYEGGQALRFEQGPIKAGRNGCLSALRHIGVIRQGTKPISKQESVIAKDSYWVRAPLGGTLRLKARLGQFVSEGQPIGEILDPLGSESTPVYVVESGYVIGINQLPHMNQGDALAHIATTRKTKIRGKSFDTEYID